MRASRHLRSASGQLLQPASANFARVCGWESSPLNMGYFNDLLQILALTPRYAVSFA
jgi:hypothetical protein